MAGISRTEDHNNNYWYYLGRASMCAQLARRFGEEAGKNFTRGHDTTANFLRTMMEEMHENAKNERKTAEEFEDKMKEEEENES